jgi:hypothetical protein
VLPQAAFAGRTRFAISPPFSRSTTAMSYWPCKSSTELCSVAEIAAEPHRRIRRDRAASVENIGDTAGRDADVERQAISAQAARRKLAFQQAAGMCNRGRDHAFKFHARHDILFHMTIEDLEKAIAKLPPDQFAQFCDWFDAFDAERFDQKIERDAKAGKLDGLAEQAIDDLRKGRARALKH